MKKKESADYQGKLLESNQEDSDLKKIRHFAGSFDDYLNYWNGRITKDN